MTKLLHFLNPEMAHSFGIKALKNGIHPCYPSVDDARLHVKLWQGTKKERLFKNPIGLAAGFDKNAEVPRAMFKLGFGFVEVGTITPKPQVGNPKPRIFRLSEDKAVINRLGFNGGGSAVAHENITEFLRYKKQDQMLGINIGKNKDTKKAADDYVKGISMFGALADYITVNISSPNTKGLRDLQQKKDLGALLQAVQKELKKQKVSPPLLVKIAPDLNETEITDIVDVVMSESVDGLIVTNTTISRPDSLQSNHAAEMGGLSGQPLFDLSTKILNRVHVLTEGKIPLVGVGGVSNAQQAIAKFRAGASLVQLYTSMIYEGPGIAHRINKDLLAFCEAEGVKSLSELVSA